MSSTWAMARPTAKKTSTSGELRHVETEAIATAIAGFLWESNASRAETGETEIHLDRDSRDLSCQRVTSYESSSPRNTAFGIGRANRAPG